MAMSASPCPVSPSRSSWRVDLTECSTALFHVASIAKVSGQDRLSLPKMSSGYRQTRFYDDKVFASITVGNHRRSPLQKGPATEPVVIGRRRR
jgi:hypothetical protein